MPQSSSNQLNSQLDTSLVSLGLSPSERELYLLSVSMGPLSVNELAAHLGLQRPYVYTLIKGLRDKGLAPIAKTYKRSFVVESPTVVLDLLRKKRQQLESLATNIAADMPKYLASYQQGGERTGVLFYEGKQKFLELYERVLIEEGTETIYFGEAEHFFSVVSETKLNQWIRDRVKKRIHMRTLMIDSTNARTIPSDETLLRETRLVSVQRNRFPASFQVYGNTVIFWQPMTPVAVALQDEYISQLMRSTFELLWSQGKKI